MSDSLLYPYVNLTALTVSMYYSWHCKSAPIYHSLFITVTVDSLLMFNLYLSSAAKINNDLVISYYIHDCLRIHGTDNPLTGVYSCIKAQGLCSYTWTEHFFPGLGATDLGPQLPICGHRGLSCEKSSSEKSTAHTFNFLCFFKWSLKM